jgi:hypothetical protein
MENKSKLAGTLTCTKTKQGDYLCTLYNDKAKQSDVAETFKVQRLLIKSTGPDEYIGDWPR